MHRFSIAAFSMLVALLLVSEAEAFSVSPIGFRSSIEPGGKQAFNIVVSNNEKGTRKFVVDVNSVRNTEDGRRYYESGADQAEFWAKVIPETFSLHSGETKTVAITFFVPNGAAPGSHPLAFLVSAENSERGEIGLTARSAIPVNLVVAGEVTERLSLKNFSSTDSFIGRRIWPFKIELYNEGTMDVQANGWLQIKNMFGKEVLSQPVVLGNAIYPQSLRRLETHIEMPAGMWPGKYTAKFAIQYGASKSSIASEAVIWFLPVWLAEVGFVVVFIFIIWLWRRRNVCP